MAAIRKNISLNVTPEAVWDAVRDVGALPRRLARGFVTECEMEGDVRVLTFFNGVTARERIVDVDDVGRRLVYAIGDAPFEHYQGTVEVVLADGDGSRMLWRVDLLPHTLKDRVEAMMDEGVRAIRATLESET